MDDRSASAPAAPAAGVTAAASKAADAQQARAEDTRLLAAHLGGDREAFSTLVTRHQDRLWAVALRTLGDREEAADAVQEALLAAFRGAATFRGEAAVGTWLHRITVNACLDRLRRARVRPTVALPDPAESGLEPADPVDAFASCDLSLDLSAALLRLPVDQRVAVLLVDVQDLPIAEAAAVLQVPEGTVKSRCARGRLRMAALLTAADGNRAAPANVEEAKEHAAATTTAATPTAATPTAATKTTTTAATTQPDPHPGPAGKDAR